MAKYIHGERVGKLGRLALGCSATIFDPERQKILLTRRTDNGRWCLPGGRVEAGESVAETCVREVWEETGLEVRILRLIGVYSSPHRVVEYSDGNRYHMVALNFEAEIVGGVLGLSNETTEYGYFSKKEIAAMDLIDPHRERIDDLFAQNETTVVR
jgi:8-oxo-dGTP pyrophosphatase MutT (NUDIX family)